VSKEDVLKNLFLVWGTKPIDHMFNGESTQFYSDLMFEGITSDEYNNYARNQIKEGN